MRTHKRGVGKRQALKEYLLDEIRLRNLKPGDRLHSRTEFMRRFRCARATVDHVISELIAQRILVGESGNGTFVARPVRRSASATLAIAMPLPPAFEMAHQMAHGFVDQLQSDFSVKYFGYGDLKQPDAWEKCKANRGIVFVQPDVPQAPLLHEARALKIPHLALYRDPPESSFVSIDNYGALAALVDALCRRGCRRIAFVAHRMGRYHFQEQRYAGYLEGLLRNRLPFDKACVGHLYKDREGDFLNRLFEPANKPDAVIACEFPLGRIIKAAKENGLEAGKDVTLANLDELPPNTYSFKVFAPRSITEEIGREGAKAFLRILDAPETLIQNFIIPDVVEQ
jgi:DNA-binding LacI/PurR family transcriptional regulator